MFISNADTRTTDIQVINKILKDFSPYSFGNIYKTDDERKGFFELNSDITVKNGILKKGTIVKVTELLYTKQITIDYGVGFDQYDTSNISMDVAEGSLYKTKDCRKADLMYKSIKNYYKDIDTIEYRIDKISDYFCSKSPKNKIRNFLIKFMANHLIDDFQWGIWGFISIVLSIIFIHITNFDIGLKGQVFVRLLMFIGVLLISKGSHFSYYVSKLHKFNETNMNNELITDVFSNTLYKDYMNTIINVPTVKEIKKLECKNPAITTDKRNIN